MWNEVHERELLQAAEILGGVHALAEHLDVDARVLIEWMKGTAGVPPDIFAKVTAVLQRNTSAPA
jgi:hypothetical protein